VPMDQALALGAPRPALPAADSLAASRGRRRGPADWVSGSARVPRLHGRPPGVAHRASTVAAFAAPGTAYPRFASYRATTIGGPCRLQQRCEAGPLQSPYAVSIKIGWNASPTTSASLGPLRPPVPAGAATPLVVLRRSARSPFGAG